MAYLIGFNDLPELLHPETYAPPKTKVSDRLGLDVRRKPSRIHVKNFGSLIHGDCPEIRRLKDC